MLKENKIAFGLLILDVVKKKNYVLCKIKFKDNLRLKIYKDGNNKFSIFKKIAKINYKFTIHSFKKILKNKLLKSKKNKLKMKLKKIN